ncbi:MAG: adenylate/guanylate cyclase domain-containing protein [Candidatus Aminicenantes bacterium]|jgi:adenylate cyclase
MKKKLVRGLVIGGIVWSLVFLLYRTQVFQPLEWQSWDLRMRLFSDPSLASEDIVIFLLDQQSLDVYEQEQGLSWPWPRQLYSALIQYCMRAQAKALVFDFVFSEGSVYGIEDDQNMADAMKKSGNVFLPFFLSRHETGTAEDLSASLERFSLDSDKVPPSYLHPMKSASLPLDVLLRSAIGAGNSGFPSDRDSIYRRIPLVFGLDGLVLPALPLALVNEIGLKTDVADIPVDRSGRMIIRYYGPTGTYESFSLVAIINSFARMEEGSEPQIAPEAFKDKIIIVGASAPGLLDLRPTPFSAVCPGAEIQATVIDNLLKSDFIRLPSPCVVFLWIAFLSLLCGIVTTFITKVWKIVAVAILFFAFPAALSVIFFVNGYWLELVGPEFAVLLSFVAANILNYGFEGRERRFLKNIFRHYLSPDVIERIIADPSLLRLGGERREVTSFFSDVAGFTSISEALSPEDLVQLLNAYLSEMTEVILDLGGTLDKYEGDAIIAFWNAPLDYDDHATRACLAAIRCQKRLQELSPEFQGRFGHSLKMRIGINSGPAVVGNMGSQKRFDYTAMGDTINLASRLEGAGKQYRVSTLIGENTYDLAKESVIAREVDIIRVVGKEKPVRVYELIGKKGQVSEHELKRIKSFHEALKLYREQKWDEALHLFQRNEDDTVSGMYAERTKRLKDNPPKADWTGVFDLTKK